MNSGAEVTVIEIKKNNIKIHTNLSLFDINKSVISTFANRNLTFKFCQIDFILKFIIAEVFQYIIVIDFLRDNSLFVDLKNMILF